MHEIITTGITTDMPDPIYWTLICILLEVSSDYLGSLGIFGEMNLL